MQSTTRPPRRSRRGELIKLATRSPNWVGCPAHPNAVKQVVARLGGTPTNTPKVFALSGCRRVDVVVGFVIAKAPNLSWA
ncbi:MAG: hypothetical protein KJ064_06065 [Anaerolineae bacterium]|nr:hypothetical protein [Anaerolineae bacterium]